MKETFYRYEFASGCKEPHTGILIGMDEIFPGDRDTQLLLKLCWIFEDRLYAPNIPRDINTISYFTKHGNRTFHKAVKAVEHAAKHLHNIDVVRIEREIDLDEVEIIYQDKHQIIIKRED